jgi:hypothetical protein
MTLRYEKTASPCSTVRILAPLAQNKMWHNGARWHSLDENGQWCIGRHANHLRLLTDLVHSLPKHPYWDRLKHRTGWWGASSYQTLSLLADACSKRIIVAPAALQRVETYFHSPTPSMCLCYDQCRYPPIPDDAY